MDLFQRFREKSLGNLRIFTVTFESGLMNAVEVPKLMAKSTWSPLKRVKYNVMIFYGL